MTVFTRLIAAPATFALALIAPTRAQAQPSAKVAVATRLTTRAPHVDGRLDDEAWRSAVVIGDFVQQRPVEGATPTERMQVRLLYDEEALYVGATLYRANPADISRTMTRRDNSDNAERFRVVLDPQQDRRTGVAFAVTAAGVRLDYRHTRDAEGDGREFQFDPIWDAATQLDSTGWTAEMRIPFSQLRFPSATRQQWGLQIDRWMPDKNEDVRWVMVPASETGYISRFGTLEGIERIHSTRPIELVPYVAGDATRRANASAANPLKDSYDGRVGVDAKFGVGSSLTVDATMNADFGQIEADPAEVNLSAFETFFDERRPFFTEGNDLLRGSGAQYFYSRRIGAPPHAAPAGDFVDMPRFSTILGAAKLTGRLPSGLSVGSLLAVTDAERARVHFVDSALTRRVPVEPRTGYALLRLQQEIGSQASTLGAALTAVRRDPAGERGLADLLAREAYYAGADWRIRWQEGRYAVTGWAGLSHIAGDTGAMNRVQRSSAHYFQRPDATHLHYDPLRTSLSGYTASLRADKDAGKRILWGAQVNFESPGYEVNDFGRVSSADDIEYNADIQVRETLPGKYLQNWRLGFDTRGSWNYAGAHQENTWNQQISLTLHNFWSASVRSSVELPTINDALTRGGPYMKNAGEWRQEFRLNSASGARIGWRVNLGYAHDQLGASRHNVGAQLTMRPAPRWTLSMEPSYGRGEEARQYVTEIAGGQRTYGTRYVFAFIDRKTISARMRVNYVFGSTLTLEGYAEPFLASGAYSSFGELDAPRTYRLREYGTDGTTVTLAADGTRTIIDGAESFSIENRDFHVRSFRSNLVLRWEWNPGSTLFLVWQQDRRADLLAEPVRFRELWRTTRAAGDHYLSLKVTYWLPLALGGSR